MSRLLSCWRASSAERDIAKRKPSFVPVAASLTNDAGEFAYLLFARPFQSPSEGADLEVLEELVVFLPHILGILRLRDILLRVDVEALRIPGKPDGR